MIVPLWQNSPPKTSGGTHETPNTNKAGGEWLLGPLRCSGRQGHCRWFHDLVVASSPWWPCQLPLGCQQADGCGARGKCCWAADVFHMFVRAWKKRCVLLVLGFPRFPNQVPQKIPSSFSKHNNDDTPLSNHYHHFPNQPQ